MLHRLLTMVLLAACLGGCAAPSQHPPQNIAEYEQHLQAAPQEFTPLSIALHNANRVLNSALPAPERIASLELIERLDLADADTLAALAEILKDPQAPEPVRSAVAGFLARKGYGAVETVTMAAPELPADLHTRQQILDYIEAHPSPTALAEVVKLWAGQKAPSEQEEVRFRRLVEKLAGRQWDTALLDALNSKGFNARGSAMEVLASRIQPEQLGPRIAAMNAQSETLQALQYFSDQLGYLPRTRSELLASAILFKQPSETRKLASRVAAKWTSEGGYRFNIRDYHLLSRLGADPLRSFQPRQELIQQDAAAMAIHRRGPADQKRVGRVVDFAAQADTLTLADLWNIQLLEGVLGRPRAQEAFRRMAQQDRADTRSRWAGLITYDQGQAEAKLYNPAEGRGDQGYVPTEQMLIDAADSLCYFVAHFDRDYKDPAQVGPDEGEMRLIREQNLYGLTLTSLKDGMMNAAYFNPAGAVIDLGDFPIGGK